MSTVLKILIVEDDVIIGEDIKKSVRNIGHEIVDFVPSGEQALERAEKLRPDLVLMDIVLRGRLNGIETAEQIHKQFQIPIVFLTAYADKITMSRAQRANPYGYILKPFEDEELKSVLEQAIEKRKKELESNK